MSRPYVAYMSRRGAGIARLVHSAEECERLLRSLLRQRRSARVFVGRDTVGEVDPDGGEDGRGTWWFDQSVWFGGDR